MLQPIRTKFRKAHKGRIHGVATSAATLAFGVRVRTQDVDTSGIEGLAPADVQAARELGLRLRLVAEASYDDRALAARVGLTLLPEEHPLAEVSGAGNHIVLEGPEIGALTIAGPGAGGPETASAIVSDPLALLRGAPDQLARLGAPRPERLAPPRREPPFALRLHAGGAAGGYIASGEGNKPEKQSNRQKCKWIKGANTIKQAGKIASQAERSEDAECCANGRQSDSLTHDKAQNVRRPRAKRHTDSDFTRPPRHLVREQSI